VELCVWLIPLTIEIKLANSKFSPYLEKIAHFKRGHHFVISVSTSDFTGTASPLRILAFPLLVLIEYLLVAAVSAAATAVYYPTGSSWSEKIEHTLIGKWPFEEKPVITLFLSKVKGEFFPPISTLKYFLYSHYNFLFERIC
jgi:hypothetical protein